VLGADQGTDSLKAQVAGSIVATLQDRHLTARGAAVATGIDPADVQRIRNGDLARFTLDRLIRVAHRLGHQVEVAVLPLGHAT
jgi:predicted XRE-type DNA-binding protein